ARHWRPGYGRRSPGRCSPGWPARGWGASALIPACNRWSSGYGRCGLPARSERLSSHRRPPAAMLDAGARFVLPGFQFFHYAADEFLGIVELFHDEMDIHDRTAWPTLAPAIDAMLAHQCHGVGDQVHGHGQPAARGP